MQYVTIPANPAILGPNVQLVILFFPKIRNQIMQQMTISKTGK